ncbi:tetratricopeptide repeat protein [Saccharothrix lopnurensis]|uniref:tetratricopeptide repeat protein n=1 Tax=Saccharothrix lopnurensis TaxID=1670621 RepID=UPI0036D323A0
MPITGDVIPTAVNGDEVARSGQGGRCIRMNGITNTAKTPAPTRSFGEELRRLRGAMTLRRFAELSHFSSGHISNVENGTKPPTEEFAKACDSALGTEGALLALYLRTCDRVDHGKRPRPAQLPPSPRLVGRTGVLRALDEHLRRYGDAASATVMALDGQAGVGKTSLAVAWAHEVKDRFPDGVFFVDLHGYSADGEPVEAAEVLEDILKALGVPSESMPATTERRSALLRTRLDGSRTLLVLDNAARAEQVRPLIPAAPGCLVLVTSRQRMATLAVRHGAFCMTVDPFDRADAVMLLRDVVGSTRVDAEPAAADRIVTLCGGLPLAVRVAAERIAASRHLTLAGLAEDLSDVNQRLDVLSPDDVEAAVRAVFSWSFRALEPDAGRLFRLLSLHPGREFGIDSASVLAQCETAKTVRMLDTLVRGHLLQEAGRHRFRFHDLLRDYAGEQALAMESGEVAAVRRRLLEWYLQAAAAANRVMSPHRCFPQLTVVDTGCAVPDFATAGDAVRWCEVELANLAAATVQAISLDLDTVAFGLPLVLTGYLYRRNPWSTWLAPLTASLDRARHQNDLPAQAWILNNLGSGHLDQHRLDEAMRCFREELGIRQRLDDRSGQAWSRIGLGRVHQAGGEHRAAIEHHRLAQAIFERLDERWAWAIAKSYIADAHRAMGECDLALDGLTQAVVVLHDLGDRQSESCALDKLGDVHRDLGDLRGTVGYLEQALAAGISVVDLWGRAVFLRKLGDVHHELGEEDKARQAWTEAIELFEALGDARARGIRAQLTALDHEPVPSQRREYRT